MSCRVGGFFIFLLVYYAPLLFDGYGLSSVDAPVQALFLDSLAIPAVQIELGRDLLGHLLPLALVYVAIVWIGVRTARALRIGTVSSCLVFLVAAWVLLVSTNGLLFPLSDYSVPFDQLVHGSVAAVSGTVLVVGFVLALRHGRGLRKPAVAVVAGSGLVAVLLGIFLSWSAAASSIQAPARNVILIGIDSLSDQVAHEARAYLPHLAALLEEGTEFKRAYTPLARTFPAWLSLLSGRAPADHGAIFNLRGLDHVQRDRLVTQTLREAGYRTVFAIDERRFSNIDESFGFDRVVGPSAGVLDFVLQRINDTPLTNLLLQTRVARYLLSFSRFNVASYASYDANGFVEEILDALDGPQPVFLAAHFESAHFPFKTRHAVRQFVDANGFRARQKETLTVVDHQIGKLMEGLRRRGRLDDALVVVLSDHGEGLGDVEIRTTRGGQPFDVDGYGHGVNLLSEQQNRVVLRLVPYRGGHAATPKTVRTDQVSLTDVRAALERYATGDDATIEPQSPCMIVETGLRIKAITDYGSLNAGEVAREAAGLYEVDAMGRLSLKESMLSALADSKDVGWRCADRLTFYSDAAGRYFAYQLDSEGRNPVEVQPQVKDIADIRDYQTKLSRIFGNP